jgi:fatty acid desaturase
MKPLNTSWALYAALWWTVILACLTLAVIGPWWTLPLAWAALGVAQQAIGTLGHEGLHRLVHTNRSINEALTMLCAWPLGLSVESWRRWHFAHHAHVGTDQDPEQPLKVPHRVRWERPGLVQGLRDLVGLSADEMLEFWMAVNRAHLWKTALFETVVWVAIALLVSWKLPLLWFTAMVTSQVVVFRLRAKTEHDIGQQGTKRTPRPPLWARWTYLPCDTWRHWEHHDRPGVRYSSFAG